MFHIRHGKRKYIFSIDYDNKTREPNIWDILVIKLEQLLFRWIWRNRIKQMMLVKL